MLLYNFHLQHNTRLDWCVIEALRGNTIRVTFKGVALGVSLQHRQHVMGGGRVQRQRVRGVDVRAPVGSAISLPLPRLSPLPLSCESYRCGCNSLSCSRSFQENVM